MLKSMLLAAAAVLSSSGAALAGATCPPIAIPTVYTQYAEQPCMPSPIALNGSRCMNCPEPQVVKRGDVLSCLQPIRARSFHLIAAHDVKGRCVPYEGRAFTARGRRVLARRRPTVDGIVRARRGDYAVDGRHHRPRRSRSSS